MKGKHARGDIADEKNCANHQAEIAYKKTAHFFLAILILPISTLAFIAYQSAVSTLDRQMMGSALDNVRQINDMINTSISQKEDGTAYFSDWLTKDRYKPKNQSQITDKFTEYMKINKDVESIYTSDTEGHFTRYPDLQMPKGYNPLERDWYKKAVENKGRLL